MERKSSFIHAFLLLATGVYGTIEQVSISEALNGIGHTCISKCLYYTVVSDMGAAMGCGTPYDNRCYCATDVKSASVADVFMSECASAACSVGDVSLDLADIQSVYGSYCINAGFTQPGASKWYSPAEATDTKATVISTRLSETAKNAEATDEQPTKTDQPGMVETTTQQAIVTQTADNTGSARTVISRVTIHETTTLVVNTDGSPANSDSSEEDDSPALKIGIGIAVPVVLLSATGIFIWWFLRRRQRDDTAYSQYPEYTAFGDDSKSPLPVYVSPISHQATYSHPEAATKATDMAESPAATSASNELSGTSVRRETSRHELRLFPSPTPIPPIAMARQQEMQEEARRKQMATDVRWNSLPREGGSYELPTFRIQRPSHNSHRHLRSSIPGLDIERWGVPDNH